MFWVFIGCFVLGTVGRRRFFGAREPTVARELCAFVAQAGSSVPQQDHHNRNAVCVLEYLVPNHHGSGRLSQGQLGQVNFFTTKLRWFCSPAHRHLTIVSFQCLLNEPVPNPNHLRKLSEVNLQPRDLYLMSLPINDPERNTAVRAAVKSYLF
jgi:hypothetical protein